MRGRRRSLSATSPARAGRAWYISASKGETPSFLLAFTSLPLRSSPLGDLGLKTARAPGFRNSKPHRFNDSLRRLLPRRDLRLGLRFHQILREPSHEELQLLHRDETGQRIAQV